MNWRGRLLLVAALLAAPAYLALDAMALVPLGVRDRPWPFAVFAIAFALSAAGWSPRRRSIAVVAAVLGAVVSCGALAGAARWRYRLPPASATAGVGELLPDLALRDQSGEVVRLRPPDVDRRPLLLVWIRGALCPYCRRQLTELSAELERFGGAGVRTLAVAPDPPEPLRAFKERSRIAFPLISDPERRLFNRCEFAHCVAIVDAKGIIRWGVASGNWETDLPAHALVQAAYRLK